MQIPFASVKVFVIGKPAGAMKENKLFLHWSRKLLFFALEIVKLNNIYANVEAFKHIFYNY